jgi:hypothetical protein
MVRINWRIWWLKPEKGSGRLRFAVEFRRYSWTGYFAHGLGDPLDVAAVLETVAESRSHSLLAVGRDAWVPSV